MSGLGEDTVPKIKISTTLFVAGERRCVLDRFRFRPVCCGFRVYCSNKPTRLGVRRRMPSRRIAGSSRGEERRRTTRRRDGRSSGPCASAPSSSDREPVKKAPKAGAPSPVCDCLEKETKTVILSDNSNEPELRVRSDEFEATTTRCRKPKLREMRNCFACASAARAPRSWSIDHHAHLAYSGSHLFYAKLCLIL